eukprot:2510520-Alexandrium_andersonii.AAC.1
MDAPASEPTEGMLGVAVVGGEVVRLVDDLNMRAGAIVEITRERAVANLENLPLGVAGLPQPRVHLQHKVSDVLPA